MPAPRAAKRAAPGPGRVPRRAPAAGRSLARRPSACRGPRGPHRCGHQPRPTARSAWPDLTRPGRAVLGLTAFLGWPRLRAHCGGSQATFRVTPLPGFGRTVGEASGYLSRIVRPPPKGPRLDRPETANWLAGRSPPRPEPTVRVDVTPRERLPHARRAAGPSPPTSTTAQGPRFGRAPATESGYKTCLRADPYR